MAVLLWSLVPHAAHALKLRVAAATRIEGDAAFVDLPAGAGRLIVRGVLRDDAGSGVANQHVAITFRASSGGPGLPVPEPERCVESEATPHEPHVAPDEYVVDTNPSGAFCVQARLPEAVSVELRFAGSGPLEPSQLDLLVGSKEASSLSFEDTPLVASLDRPLWEVHAKLTHVPPNVTWRVRLRDERGHLLGDAPVAVDGQLRWEIPTSELADPGRGELVASLQGAGAADVSVTQSFERHARVNLQLPNGSRPEYREGTNISVNVSSARGPVPSGLVEARVVERTLETTAVHNGQASWTARAFREDSSSSEVELRYGADAPWWEPGAALTLALPTARHIRWIRLALIAFALLVAGWMMRGLLAGARLPRWRARAGSSAARAAAISAAVAHSRALEPERVIRVLDAHDGSPVRDIEVRINVARFPESGADATPSPAGSTHARDSHHGQTIWAQAAAGGVVHLPTHELPTDAVLRIQSPLHVGVTLAVPQPGTTVVRLVARRRHLLDRLLNWAAREAQLGQRQRDPTPHQIAEAARTRAPASEVEAWARAVESAAFGNTPVDEHVERQVLALEPKPAGIQELERPAR